MTWRSIEADCAECYAMIFFHQQPGLGQLITCHVCNTRLEVVWIEPLRLSWALDEDLANNFLDHERFMFFNSDDIDETEEDQYDNRDI